METEKTTMKTTTEKLPTCPEICKDCLSGKHNFHVEDELGCLHVHVEKEMVHGREVPKFIIRGYAEGDGDHFWLRRILEMAFRAACKAPIEKLPIGCSTRYHEIIRRAGELSETFVNGNRKHMVETLEQMEPRSAFAVLSTMMVHTKESFREDLNRFLKEVG